MNGHFYFEIQADDTQRAVDLYLSTPKAILLVSSRLMRLQSKFTQLIVIWLKGVSQKAAQNECTAVC
jgi:hypothetical protein